MKELLKKTSAQWQSTENSVMKDVVRTDRKNPFYQGENNPNVEMMKYVCIT